MSLCLMQFLTWIRIAPKVYSLSSFFHHNGISRSAPSWSCRIVQPARRSASFCKSATLKSRRQGMKWVTEIFASRGIFVFSWSHSHSSPSFWRNFSTVHHLNLTGPAGSSSVLILSIAINKRMLPTISPRGPSRTWPRINAERSAGSSFSHRTWFCFHKIEAPKLRTGSETYVARTPDRSSSMASAVAMCFATKSPVPEATGLRNNPSRTIIAARNWLWSEAFLLILSLSNAKE